jgi:phosphate starvation-inducible PhoH-like protein
LSTVEISFTPVDNQRLSNLCGVLDENLKQIAAALDVSIARRENFSVAGDPGPANLAAQALKRFYQEATRSPMSKTCSWV